MDSFPGRRPVSSPDQSSSRPDRKGYGELKSGMHCAFSALRLSLITHTHPLHPLLPYFHPGVTIYSNQHFEDHVNPSTIGFTLTANESLPDDLREDASELGRFYFVCMGVSQFKDVSSVLDACLHENSIGCR